MLLAPSKCLFKWINRIISKSVHAISNFHYKLNPICQLRKILVTVWGFHIPQANYFILYKILTQLLSTLQTLMRFMAISTMTSLSGLVRSPFRDHPCIT